MLSGVTLPRVTGSTGYSEPQLTEATNTPAAPSDPAPQSTPRHGKLSKLADELLKDIDVQMRSLSASEQETLKSQFHVLMDASIALIDRDAVDASSPDARALSACRRAVAALHGARTKGTDVSQKADDATHSPQFRTIERTLQQLAQCLERELNAVLRDARRSAVPAPVAAPQAENVTGHDDFLQALSEAKTLLQALSTEPRDWMTPGLSQKDTTILRERHKALRDCLERMQPPPAPQNDTVLNFIRRVEEWERHLQHHLDNHDDYQSPDSIAKICDARQIEIDAAIHVLKSQKKGQDHSTLIKSLEDRRHRLDLLKLAPGDADAGRLLGKKAVSSRLIHPIDAARQAIKLEKAGQRWLAAAAKGPAGTRRAGLELDGISEPMLMEWLLKKAGVVDAGKALRTAHRRTLDSRPFDVIHSEIAVPMEGSAAPQALKATTTPASHVLCDASRIRLADDNPVLNPANASQYLHRDSQGHQIRGGFNSHDTTEHLHPTLAAHDDLSLHGTPLFGATRHGVAAPYALSDELLTLEGDTAIVRVQSLLGPETLSPTRLSMAWQGEALPPMPASTEPGITNPIHAAFKSLLQAKIDQQNHLTATLIQSGLQDDTESSVLAGLSADDLMNKPEHAALLLAMIRNHPDLRSVLVRQAALNRVRELVILEIARNPRHGEKIKAGEAIVFTSLSLLTPDALRHAVCGMMGTTSFDERAMLEVQLQAWEDLKNEVHASGIVINGHALKATFCPFNFGVNNMALLGPGSDPIIGEVLSGHDFSSKRCNAASLSALVGLPEDDDSRFSDNATDQAILRIERQLSSPALARQERQRLDRDLKAIKGLQRQIRQMWSDGSYRRAGNEPYKMPARIALLSFLIGGGTLFNCKSGKDRTGQLSVEAKFLALRIENHGGDVPEPDAALTPWEHVQYGCLLFYDKARTLMQKYATGYEGSKLSYAKKAFAYFSRAIDDLPKSERMRLLKSQVREFIGLSSRAAS